jgi:hypothetical protein
MADPADQVVCNFYHPEVILLSRFPEKELPHG